MLQRILIIDTNYPINSRNRRIYSSLVETYGKDNVGIVAWNRKPNILSSEEYIYIYNDESPLGKKLDKLKRLRNYSKFIQNQVSIFNPTVIIASHWDSLMLSARYHNDGIKLIYENLDMPSGSKPIRFLLRQIEKYCLKRTDAIVHASRFFKDYYKWFNGPQIIVENYPMVDITEEKSQPIRRLDDDTLHVVFNGGLRYAQSMINLIKAVDKIPNISVDFWGYPVGKEGQMICEAGENVENVTFHGSYNYDEIGYIMENTDVLWAVYTSTSFNVKNAISNKFHESLFYEIPGIYARDTKLGKLVDENEIGFTIDEFSIEDIRKNLLFIRDNKKKLLQKYHKKIQRYKISQPKNWIDGFRPFLSLLDSM